AAARRAPAAPAADVRWHAADLLLPGEPERLVARVRPERLLHLAWSVEPGAFWRAPENLDWVGASLALARAFAERGGRRAVFAGTCAEYEWSGGRCRERETPLVPATLYGAAKKAVHEVVEVYAREAGVSAAWGRIFLLYGPHEPPGRLVSSVARALLLGEPAPCSRGGQLRDFLHVADVAGAFAALLESGVEGPVNVASGEAVPVGEVVARLAEAAGRPELVRWGELPERPGDPALLAADVARLRGEVGWAPRYTLARGLEETVAWWRSELAGRRPGRAA
ncbi:MAG TPA: NAD(P)-dependent oxidoreductase, partial [Longimicrobium sp.]